MEQLKKQLRNAVIDIEEVEYWIRPNAAEAIARGEEFVTLLRLFDKIEISVRSAEITKSLKSKGVIDRIDKRKGSL